MYRQSAEQRKRAQVQALATELYNDHYNRLLGIAKGNTPTRADAEEALQEAFVAFISHYNPGSGAPPIAWLTLTLKRMCWAKARYAHRELSSHAPDSATDDTDGSWLNATAAAGDMTEQVEQVHDARQALSSLKPDERQALGLLGLGYSYKEICQLTGWSYTKVNRCISEGRAAVRSSHAENH